MSTEVVDNSVNIIIVSCFRKINSKILEMLAAAVGSPAAAE